MTTPADELRQAAALLREVAAAATSGPWHRPLNTRYKSTVTGALPEGERGNWIDGIDPTTGEREQCTVALIPTWSTGRHSRQRGGRDLEYIATMHPGVGLALADWLDAEAGGLSGPDTVSTHALVVARQILGTAGEPATVADQPDTETEAPAPIPLRWGLDDVMYGDDDTTVVMLSGPNREPYWVELDTERTDALRNALAGPEPEAAPTVDRATVLREAADRFERECPDPGGPMDLCMCHATEPLREWADEQEAADAYARAINAPLNETTCEAIRRRLESGPPPRRLVRRLAAEAQQPETHACDNCDGIDPDTCFNNPHQPPEQCPAAEFEDYGQQCQKPVGHELHTFEERPAADQPDTETEEPAV